VQQVWPSRSRGTERDGGGEREREREKESEGWPARRPHNPQHLQPSTSPQGLTKLGLEYEPFLGWQIRIRISGKVNLRSEDRWFGLSVRVGGYALTSSIHHPFRTLSCCAQLSSERRPYSPLTLCKPRISRASVWVSNKFSSHRFRAKREQLQSYPGLLAESQGHNLAFTVLRVPYSLGSGPLSPVGFPWDALATGTTTGRW